MLERVLKRNIPIAELCFCSCQEWSAVTRCMHVGRNGPLTFEEGKIKMMCFFFLARCAALFHCFQQSMLLLSSHQIILVYWFTLRLSCYEVSCLSLVSDPGGLTSWHAYSVQTWFLWKKHMVESTGIKTALTEHYAFFNLHLGCENQCSIC